MVKGDFSKSFINKPTAGNEDCGTKSAQFFIQYRCKQHEEDQYEKYNQIAFVTVCVLFVAFFFILYIQYLKQNAKLDVLKYDLRTITASDFTVEMDITKNDWATFLQAYETEGKEMENDLGQTNSPGLYFKTFLKDSVEEAIIETLTNKYENFGFEKEPNANIVDI